MSASSGSNRHFAEVGSRYYSSNEPSLVRTVGTEDELKSPYGVMGFTAWTATVISNTSVYQNGYDGDSALFGQTVPANTTVLGRFKRLVFTSGTGQVFLE